MLTFGKTKNALLRRVGRGWVCGWHRTSPTQSAWTSTLLVLLRN